MKQGTGNTAGNGGEGIRAVKHFDEGGYTKLGQVDWLPVADLREDLRRCRDAWKAREEDSRVDRMSDNASYGHLA